MQSVARGVGVKVKVQLCRHRICQGKATPKPQSKAPRADR